MSYPKDQGHGSQNSPTALSSDFEHYEGVLAFPVPLDTTCTLQECQANDVKHSDSWEATPAL